MTRQIRLLAFSLILVLLAGGCGRSNLKLVYVSTPGESFPSATSAQVCVVKAEDARKSAAVGVRSDGTPFDTESNVADWVTHALAAELAKNGLTVTVASSEEEARASGAKNVLKARIDEVWLVENSSISYSCSMRLYVQLVGPWKAALLTNSFQSSLSRQVVPLSSVPEEMLKETLEELVRPVGLSVSQKLRSTP